MVLKHREPSDSQRIDQNHSFILYSFDFNMKVSQFSLVVLAAASVSGNVLKKRSGFSQGEPIDDNGKGAPILGKLF